MTVGGDGVPAPDTTTTVEAKASPSTSEAATGDPTALTGPAASALSSSPWMVAATTLMGTDDNAIEEPEFIMGHPGIRAPGTVSLSEVGHSAFCTELGARCAPLGQGGHQRRAATPLSVGLPT
jgi:hypothetical protein